MKHVNQTPSPTRWLSWIEKHINLISLMIVGIWCILHITWCLLDRFPMWGDQVFYVTGAIEFLRAPLFSPKFLQLIHDATGTGFRPPGTSLLLAPMLWLSGCHIPLLKAASLVWFGLAGVFVFLLSKTIYGSHAGWLAVLFFTILLALPPIYPATGNPELFLMAIVPAILYFTCNVWHTPGRPLRWFAIGCLTAMGLLFKWIAVIYLLGPIIYCAFSFFSQSTPPGSQKTTLPLLRDAFFMLVPVLLVGALWYWPHTTALAAAFADIADSQGYTPFHTGWSWKVPLFYPSLFLRLFKILPTLLLLAGLGFSIFLLFSPKKQDTVNTFGLHILLAAVVGFWVYFSLRYENLPVKYLYPLLPILAILSTGGVTRIPKNSIRQAWIAIIAFYALFNAVWVHCGITVSSPTNIMQRFYQVEPDRPLLWYTLPNHWPPKTEPWPFQPIIQTMRQDKANPNRPHKVLVLTDLHYFNWFSCQVPFLLDAPQYKPVALTPWMGLLHLHQADYIITSRGRISRFPYAVRQQKPASRNAQAMGRWMEQSPAWLANHYRLIGRFSLPKQNDTLQLYSRKAQLSSAAIIHLCEFWITHHLNMPEAWEQIRIIHNRRGNAARAKIAQDIQALLHPTKQNKREQFQTILANHKTFTCYEKLQLGKTALERNNGKSGTRLLNECLECDAPIAWKAALLLGKWHASQENTTQAEKFGLKAWRLNPYRPEPLQILQNI
ncbi:hypothetical protein GF373_17210 [bacterium]|nr:hypothetical protein [bacterium]